MSEKHLSSQFDTDLTSISTKVLQMGGLVEAQIARAMRALANFDTDMCDQVLAVEQEINALEIEIDGDCNNIIARRQPTARDLRLVMAISKTITNLERAGDEAAKIAKRTKRLMQDPSA
ncbi:transcriptional regulator PhoU, partial [Desulfocarbo indianensis]